MKKSLHIILLLLTCSVAHAQQNTQDQSNNFYGVQDSTDIDVLVTNPVHRQPASDCAATTVAWSANGFSCSGSVGTTLSGSNFLIEDFKGAGSVYATCNGNSGAVEIVSGTEDCGPAPICPSQNISWTVGSNACSGDISQAQAGEFMSTTASNANATGNADFECGYDGTNAVWQVASGSTCVVTSPCPANEVITWTGSNGAVCNYTTSMAGSINQPIYYATADTYKSTDNLNYQGSTGIECRSTGWYANPNSQSCNAYIESATYNKANTDNTIASNYCSIVIPAQEYNFATHSCNFGNVSGTDVTNNDGIGNNYVGNEVFRCEEVTANNYVFQVASGYTTYCEASANSTPTCPVQASSWNTTDMYAITHYCAGANLPASTIGDSQAIWSTNGSTGIGNYSCVTAPTPTGGIWQYTGGSCN